MKRSTCLKVSCGLAALVAVVWCSKASAQYYRPVVVVRPPVAVYRPVVVRPAPMVVRSYPVYPVVYREPAVVYTAPNPAPMPISVTLVNPPRTGTPLSFTIRGTQYTLEPGARQELHFGGPRTIEFDRGAPYGIARMSLTEGVFAFTATDHGWTLRRWSE